MRSSVGLRKQTKREVEEEIGMGLRGRGLASGMDVPYVEAGIIGKMNAQIEEQTRAGSTAGVGKVDRVKAEEGVQHL